MEGGLRERRKERVRADMVSAAFGLFSERGFERTTVDAIAERAGVSRRTYFRYFPTKEAVVLHAHNERLTLFESFLREAAGPTGVDAVRQCCVRMARRYMDQRESLLAVDRLVRSTPTLVAHELEQDREYEAAMARAIYQRDPKRGAALLRARLLAGACMGLVRATLRGWFDAGSNDDLVRLARRAFRLFAEVS